MTRRPCALEVSRAASPVAEEDVVLRVHGDRLCVEQRRPLEVALVDGIVGLLHLLGEGGSVLEAAHVTARARRVPVALAQALQWRVER